MPDVRLVIPLKGGPNPKSRFGGTLEFRRALARAMALDTVEAALAVAPVTAVTTDDLAADVAALGADIVRDPGQGLNAALEVGLRLVSTGSTRGGGSTTGSGLVSTGSTRGGGSTTGATGLVSTGSTRGGGSTTGATGLVSTGSTRTGVLLGDLPGLDPRELEAALSASVADLSFVADADGTGTILVVAKPGIQHRVAFGADSRRAHLANGYVELLEPWPTLRRDVDRVEHLAALTRGRRTLELLGKL